MKTQHLPCDSCGSSDARTDYGTSSHCFSCGAHYYKKKEEQENLSNDIFDQLRSSNTTPDRGPKRLTEINGDFREMTDRGISKATAEKYKVYKPVDSFYSWGYPQFKGDQHVANKFRLSGDKKGFSVDGDFNKSELFGRRAFPEGSAREITITEGYEDAMAAYEMQGSKYPCVSVHSASTARKDCADNFEYLNSFDKIVVCFDKDEAKVLPDGSKAYPGQEAAQAVAALFPAKKIRILTLSKAKDANDYLRLGLKKEFVDEWWKAPTWTPDGLILGTELWDEISSEDKTESVDYPFSGLTELTYGMRLGQLIVITADTGVGKALALDTVIPTPEGWTTMGALKPGDVIISDDGKPCKVTFVTPVQLDRKCYEIVFDDGSKIIADEDHNWLTNNKVSRDKERAPKVRTTKELLKTLEFGSQRRANHSIENTKPLELPEEILEIPPYTLGVWLGDGSSASDYIWSNDPEVPEYVRQDGYYVEKKKVDYGYKVHGLRNQLRLIGVLGDKHIPQEYLRASFSQRLALLQGLMDTDGYNPGNCKPCEFTSTKKQLAKDTFELIASLGIKVRFREGRATLHSKDCGPKYRLQFVTRLPVFKLKRKLEKLPYDKAAGRTERRYIKEINPVESVPVRCIQVDAPSHMFLCGDTFIPTHNTSVLKEIEHYLLNHTSYGLGIMHLEESKKDTGLGIMSIEANLPLHLPDVRSEVTQEELRKYYDKTVNSDRVIIYDHFGSNAIDDLLTKIRHMAAMGAKFIVLDHLSIVVSDQSGDERKQLDEISTKIKTLTMELNICVIAVIHQNRQGQIRGTAGVEQLANIVIKLYRDKEHDDETVRNTTKVSVQKNRFSGRTGPACYLFYDAATGRLQELDKVGITDYESKISGKTQEKELW